jgi:hypothetical protein
MCFGVRCPVPGVRVKAGRGMDKSQGQPQEPLGGSDIVGRDQAPFTCPWFPAPPPMTGRRGERKSDIAGERQLLSWLSFLRQGSGQVLRHLGKLSASLRSGQVLRHLGKLSASLRSGQVLRPFGRLRTRVLSFAPRASFHRH